MLLLRIDDCGWLPGLKDRDRDLDFFRRYRDLFLEMNIPAVWGFIPYTLGRKEIAWLEKNKTSLDMICVHGCTHARGEKVTLEKMKLGKAKLLNSDIYIPPFNEYFLDDIENWKEAGGKYFLGGYERRGEASLYNIYKNKPDSYFYIPGREIFYNKIEIVLNNLNSSAVLRGVVTLHITWDNTNWNAIKRLSTFSKFFCTIEDFVNASRI